MKLLSAAGTVLRLGGALIALLFSIAVGLGSGVSDLIVILGAQLTPAQTVLVGELVFGSLLVWDNATLRRRLAGHSDAPFIAWLYPSAEMYADGTIAVDIECENAGPRDSEAVSLGPFAESSRRGEQLAISIPVWSRILSRKNGDQHRFTVQIRSVPSGPPWFGEREIRWGLIYFDGANRERVYVTEAELLPEGV